MNARSRWIAQAAGLVEATALFLFFYQALRVLFSVLFGLMYDALFAGRASMTTVGLVLSLVVLALLSPLAIPRQPAHRRIGLLVSALLVFLARIPLTPDDPQGRLVASVLIVAGTGVYLACRLRQAPRHVVRALILALVTDQLLRAAGHTWDVTLRDGWLGGQVAVSLGLCLLTGWLFWQRLSEEGTTGVRLGFLGGLAWGSWLFLETSLLNFPHALARWSGMPYLSMAALWPVVTLLPWLDDGLWLLSWGRAGAGVGLVALLAGLTLGFLLTGPIALVGLVVARLIALRALAVCFLATAGEPKAKRRSPLAWGGVLFLLLSFANAFAFTYPYTLDLFRGMGLPVMLGAGFLLGLASLGSPTPARPAPWRPAARLALIVAAAVLTMGVVALTPTRRLQSPSRRDTLAIATYNIHYGYDTDWHLSLEEQAETIETSGADVVMLQEVDTGRPTSFMIDDALWLAHRLGMEAVYLPTIEHLTGIALLTRYPILRSDTLLLPSELEQTGIIGAELDVGGISVNAFAVWLGLEPEERARQLDAALPFLAAHPGPAVWGGDFNSTPDSPVYARIRDAGFVDPFVALGLDSPPTDPAVNPEKRIDFVWLRGLEPLAARVLDSLASDHRLVVVEVWPSR